MRGVLWVVFLASVVAGVCQGQVHAPAGRPGAGRDQPGGKWQCWSDAGLALTVGYGGDSIYLGGSGLVWRYDVKTGKREVFTPCDGLPLEQDVVVQLAVASDGRCALRFSRRSSAYLYRPGEGWRELPLPQGGRNVAFSPDNTLYCLQWEGPGRTRIWRLDDSEWKVVANVPPCQAFVPLASGFLLGHLRVKHNGGSRSVIAYVGPEGGEPTVYEKQEGVFMDAPQRHFHVGQDTYVILRSRSGQDGYRRVTPRGLLKDDRAAKLDPANAMPVPKGKPSGIPEADRARRQALMRMPGLLPALRPPQHLADHGAVLNGRRYIFDPARRVWADLAAGLAPVFRNACDPVTRQAWWSTTVDGKRVWQLVTLEGGKRLPLRSIPEPQILGGFKFKDSAGRWWGAGRTSHREEFFAFSLDANDAIHRYPCARGIDGGYRPQVQLSPNGKVWIWTEKTCLRYDQDNDKFFQDDPWEDFAFAFGPWRLSMAGPISSFGQAVYRKEDGAWRPMPEPFGKGTLWGTPAMIRGDRMLISGTRGVMEYSAKDDRWVLLHEYGGFRAGFTPTGQRVLVNRYCVLLYDGDPMAPATRDAQKEQAVVDELLKLMDNDRWRVRDDATQKLKKLYPAVGERVAAAAKDTSLSMEVRIRLQEILRENASDWPMGSLFRSMHPLR